MPDFSITIVSLADGGFSPKSQPVPQFSLVTWNNTTDQTHQVVLDDGSFTTDPILAEDSSKPDFYVNQVAPTSIPYHCAIHTAETGEIVVTAVVNLNP
jgi:plastocyanin